MPEARPTVAGGQKVVELRAEAERQFGQRRKLQRYIRAIRRTKEGHREIHWFPRLASSCSRGSAPRHSRPTIRRRQSLDMSKHLSVTGTLMRVD